MATQEVTLGASDGWFVGLVVALTLGLFAAACCLPTVDEDRWSFTALAEGPYKGPDVGYGLLDLFLGWLSGHPAWFANPTLLVALILLLVGWRSSAAAAGTLSASLGITTCFTFRVQQCCQHRSETRPKHRPGVVPEAVARRRQFATQGATVAVDLAPPTAQRRGPSQGMGRPSLSPKSRAAAYTPWRVTAAYRSKWFPDEPHRKQRYTWRWRCTAKDRLRAERDRWTGQGPRRAGPARESACQSINSRTSEIEIISRTARKSMPGTNSLPGDATARNREEEPVGLQAGGRSETPGVDVCINTNIVSSSTISQLPVGNSTRSAATGKEWPRLTGDVSARVKVPKFRQGTQQLGRPSSRSNVADDQADISSCRPGRSQADVLA
jgi:hypothetical protein